MIYSWKRSKQKCHKIAARKTLTWTVTFLNYTFIHLCSIFLPAHGVQLIEKFTKTFH